jgi:predicted GTPase
MAQRKRVVIMGAGGRDFHVFNTCYRTAGDQEVVAFTAAQIPHIEDRRYPPVLSGDLYPDGIRIVPEDDLESLIDKESVDEVVFAYSDVSNEYVENQRKRVEEAGARFSTFDAERCMIEGSKPCVAVCAVRTGSGKSPVSRHIAHTLKELGQRVAVLRHPMPYGHLERQVVQRFAEIADLEKNECTIEEMEEYEPHIEMGHVVYAGADYAKILEQAEKEADVILWDGGNNDNPFVKPNLFVTLLDPLRPGHELRYFPSRFNLENADLLLITKTDQASEEGIATVKESAASHNPDALVLMGESPFTIDDPSLVRGKRVLVIEDGPTTTHGGMGYGAGFLAAKEAGAAEIVDPRPHATGEIAEAFENYPHLKDVLPALGYGEGQLRQLQETIAGVDCDTVVVGTPIDLSRVIEIRQPTVRVTYSYADAGEPHLAEVVRERLGLG